MGSSKCGPSYAMPAANRDAASRRQKSEMSSLEGFPVTHLRPPPGRAKPANLADLPFDNFEPPPELLKSSGHHLGGKILRLLKLRKKSSSAATTTTHLPMDQELHQPSLRVFHFQDLVSHSTQFPAPHVDDVTKRYNYDSDEHSGNYASDTQNSSSSASIISSSSRNSSSIGQSFDSNRSSGTPRSPLCSGQLSNSQLMANILISIMDEEDSTASGSASEEHGSSEGEVQIMASLNGPHESAWHQPRDEMLNVDSPTARGRRSSSTKHLSSGRQYTPKSGTRCAVAGDGRLTSPGPSRRFGKLDLSRAEVHKLR